MAVSMSNLIELRKLNFFSDKKDMSDHTPIVTEVIPLDVWTTATHLWLFPKNILLFLAELFIPALVFL